MENQEIDLIKEFEELETKAKTIDEVVKLYKTKILELQSQIQLTELSVQGAEQRAKSAEELAEKAKENYGKAIEFENGKYEQLIHDLFKVPQKELVSQMEAHSASAYKLTMLTAVGSIVISLLVSLYFQSESTSSTNKLIARTEESQKITNNLLNSLKAIEKKTESINKDIWATDPNIKKIVRVISESKNDFKGYQSKNDLALLYKVRLNSKFPDVKYDDFLRAFKVSEIGQEVLPASDELRVWDTQYMELCKKAVNLLKDKMSTPNIDYTNSWLFKPDIYERFSNTNGRMSNSNRAVSNTDSAKFVVKAAEKDKFFATYKIESDETEYNGWGWLTPDLTCADLRDNFQRELDAVQKRINLNQ